ncbi:MAG: hypothetical protein LH618_08205 [Saprospiraceae bacterium]|nr:hypothetical protein [Saprospiraceae bacterium]
MERISNIYYRWNLIINDPDDHKYTDCAVAANATYVVSDDADFRILKRTGFPPLKLLSGNEFLELLKIF